MKYYSTQRPIMPSSFPKLDDNKVVEICNFDKREAVKEINRMAWGWIEYEKPLPVELAKDYELTAAKGTAIQ